MSERLWELSEQCRKSLLEKDYHSAIPVLHELIDLADPSDAHHTEMSLANVYAQVKDSDKALYYANKSLEQEKGVITFRHYSLCEILTLLGRKEESETLVTTVVEALDREIIKKEESNSTTGLCHTNKAYILADHYRDFDGAVSVIQRVIDKQLYSNNLEYAQCLGKVHMYRNNLIARHPIDQYVGVVLSLEFDLIENERDRIIRRFVPEFVTTWNPDLPWDIKDGYIHLLLDQKDDVIRPIMEDGLDSPLVENRASALQFLSGGKIQLDDLCRTKGVVDKHLTTEAIIKWRET